jgi:hypothetical protein
MHEAATRVMTTLDEASVEPSHIGMRLSAACQTGLPVRGGLSYRSRLSRHMASPTRTKSLYVTAR